MEFHLNWSPSKSQFDRPQYFWSLFTIGSYFNIINIYILIISSAYLEKKYCHLQSLCLYSNVLLKTMVFKREKTYCGVYSLIKEFQRL